MQGASLLIAEFKAIRIGLRPDSQGGRDYGGQEPRPYVLAVDTFRVEQSLLTVLCPKMK